MPNYYNQYPMYQPYQNNMQNTMQNTMQAQPQPQIQNGGLVSVRSEEEARNYPVAIGTSVIFKDENAPYIYTKTMGFSQMEAPRFEKYKLSKESPDVPTQQANTGTEAVRVDNTAITKIEGEIKAIWGEIEGLKRRPAQKKNEGGRRNE